MDISVKALIRSWYVAVMDVVKGTPFAKEAHVDVDMPYYIEVSQPFRPSESLESKKHNLREAAKRINKVVIKSGEVFSFWHIVGNPNDAARFKTGRTIHNGVVRLDLGGGLCQASGIIHHAVLLSGMNVIERYNHSVDLYTEETRFAPIGTDATVFFGFKDFRFQNNFSGAIRVELIVEEDILRARLYSELPFEEIDIKTEIEEISADYKKVTLLNAANDSVINESVYKNFKE
ncbi:MAG: VanW family protein [Prevotella sp.]|nr:VanW family protein [Prevotella sp.]